MKQKLQSIDDSAAAFTQIGKHPALGDIHFAHIPLTDLKAHFPETYRKLHDYQSVALVRDPVDRFVSAVFQRLREFKGYNQSAITVKAFTQEATRITRHLASTPERLSLEYVHFYRQTDFVHEGNRQLVSQVFRLDQLELASDFIAECTGLRIEENDRHNRSTELRAGRFKPFVRILRVPYALLLPLPIREKIRSMLLDAGIYGDIPKERFVEPGGWLSDFLKNYYREDFALFANARRPERLVPGKLVNASCLARA